MSLAQDDEREKEQIKIFGLTATSGRSNKYIHDAELVIDSQIFKIELKTSNVTKKQVSTCRSFDLKKIDIYKRVWWIFSQYQATQGGNILNGIHYLAHGEDLTGWLEKQRAKIATGTKTYAGLDDWQNCKELIKESIPASVLERLENCFMKKGCTLNDPKIPWSEVEKVGTKIDASRPAQHLRQLLVQGKRQ